jgi:succinyl-CoA synthetase alpha subunit
MDDVPIFNSVKEAREKTGCNASMIWFRRLLPLTPSWKPLTPAVELVVCITEGVPVLDMMKVKNYLATRTTRLIGPNCPGIITPGECKIGIMPGPMHKPGGPWGVVSRSGTLTYEAVHQLTQAGLGKPPASVLVATPSTGPTSSIVWSSSHLIPIPKPSS